MDRKYKIGFIGQGWVGKNYANDFENRGFNVVRYSIEPEYVGNKEKIKDCDIVFLCVPTPTTPSGFDLSIVDDVIKLVGKGKIAVIKSTIMPGSTKKIQAINPGIFVMHSPEFLTEVTAAYDSAHPDRNIIGIVDESHRERAGEVMSILTDAPYKIVCNAVDAELIKYAGNCWFYVKVIYMNILYDVANKLGCDWGVIKDSMAADSRIGETHLDPVHKSGRGAGGHCLLPETKVLTDRGIRDIDCISIGDSVITHTGRFGRVTDVFKRHIDDQLLCIRGQGLQPFYITKDHLVYSALSGRSYKGIKQKKLSNPKLDNLKLGWNFSNKLSIGDYLAFPKFTCKLGVSTEHPDFTRLMGYYVAEGHSDGKRISFCFNINEVDYHTDVINLMFKFFKLKVCRQVRKDTNNMILRFGSKQYAPVFDQFGHGAENKCVPDSWLFLSDECLRQFLCGYCRGDGSFSRGRFTSATISKKLDEQLRFMFYRLGIVCNSKHFEEKIDKVGQKHRKSYFLCVANLREAKKVASICGYSLKKTVKLERITSPIKDDYLLRSIRDIEEIKYTGDVYNLEVENDNSYLCLDGCFHNCFVKDMAAFICLYQSMVGDKNGMDILLANEKKNIELMLSTNKDLDLLKSVYGDDIVKDNK